MTLQETLNFKRLFLLMVNDFKLQAKNIMIVSATIMVLLALLPFHFTSDPTVYFAILFIGGFIISSFAFSDYHDSRKAILFLTLPCSNLERFLSRWLLTAVVYALGLLAIYYLCSLLSYAVNLFIYHQQFQLLNIFQPIIWLEIGKYIVLQAVVLLGAITFRKYALVKTALVIGCLFLAFSIFFALTTWIFCPNCLLSGYSFHISTQNNDFIYWLIAAPFLWLVTYLRLNEIELR